MVMHVLGVWKRTRARAPRNSPGSPSARKTWPSMLAVVAGTLSAASREDRRICRRSLARSSGLVRYEAAAPAKAEL